jgi:DNA-binding LacI/PurR family transcriptional regulator
MKRTKRATIHDVARQAGVCIATVSRVINDKNNVLPETRQRILDVIENTGYRPNAIGRGLVLRRSHNILLEHFCISDPYFVALADGVSQCCHSIRCRMLVADCKWDAAIEAEHLSHVRDGSVDGMIISPLPVRDNIPLFRDLARSGFPIVVIDNPVPTVQLTCVKYDDRAAGAMAMDYLFAKGHRRIAFLQRRHDFHTVRDRRMSYEESIRNQGMAVDPACLVILPFEFNEWDRDVFRRLLALPNPPTALLTENEIVAVATINLLTRMNVRVPNDLAVMGIGDAIQDSLVPVPLTTVSLHPELAAEHAVRLLNELIENPRPAGARPRRHVQKPSLVVRASA